MIYTMFIFYVKLSEKCIKAHINCTLTGKPSLFLWNLIYCLYLQCSILSALSTNCINIQTKTKKYSIILDI